MLTQKQQQQPSIQAKPKQRLLVPIAITLIVSGSTVWVLSISHVIKGPWSDIIGAIFAILGLVLALFPPQPQSTHVLPLTNTPQSGTRRSTSSSHLQIKGVVFTVNKHKGALVVYVKKPLRGASVNITCGFDTQTLKVDIASNVVKRKVNGRGAHVAVFPSLNVGNYVVHTEAPELQTKVSIYAGQVTEIDWR